MSAKTLLQIINAFLCVLLIAFAAVQYNDPDFYFWAPVYLLPAALAGLAAYRPQRLHNPPFSAVLLVCIVASIVGTLWFWPTEEGFWRREVWWESETAREGMGVMIVAVALFVVAIRLSRSRPAAARCASSRSSESRTYPDIVRELWFARPDPSKANSASTFELPPGPRLARMRSQGESCRHLPD